MKSFRRPRVIFGFFYIVFIMYLIYGIYNQYVLPNPSLFANNAERRIILGISIVEPDTSTLLSNLGDPNQSGNWSTSFALQSQSPTAQIFLDYIAIYGDRNIPDNISLESVSLSKSDTVPLEVFSEIVMDDALGKLENLPTEYTYKFNEPLVLEKGRKYFLPHLFIGFVSENAFSNLSIAKINGYRSFDFFPFDEQIIPLDFSVHGTIDDERTIQPSIEATISQQGWIGSFSTGPNQETLLHLKRPAFYKWILGLFFILMLAIIPSLNNVVDDAGGFFEVSFGLLLGLWGTHEILIPSYVSTSIPIDFAIYILYVLVVGEMLVVLADELILQREKRRLYVKEFNTGLIDEEFIEIENKSIFPIDMTSWLLFDQEGNRYKFPAFALRGKRRVFGKPRTVRIWTKGGRNDDENLYWGRKTEVWNDHQDIVHLEDSKGEAIFIYPYDK